MYKHILARDIKRKKSMNIILLIFIILAATFVASSVNNIVTISNALPTYFDKAELKDYYIITISDEKNNEETENFLKTCDLVEDFAIDDCVYLANKVIKLEGDRQFEENSIKLITTFSNSNQMYFDINNNPITSIGKDEVYFPVALANSYDVEVGDKIIFDNKGEELELTVAGVVKDALLGAKMMGVGRFIVSDEFYNKVAPNFTEKQGKVYCISSNDVDDFEQLYNKQNITAIFWGSISAISISYVLDMVIAAILLILSVILILISMVILRFTIVFTLSEEFREIGIMKAIGIKNRKIRGLYTLKYLMLSIVGSAIGLVLSIPFSSILMASVTDYMVIENTSMSFIFNIISVIAVVAVIVLFCIFCTRRVKKFSPIDAIRNGNGGERFKRKGLLRLSRSKLGTIPFMAFNDILSSFKRYIILIIVFALGTLLMILPINCMNTLASPSTITMFGMTNDCHLYIEDNKALMDLMVEDRQASVDYISSIEKTLNENGMPCTVFIDTTIPTKIEFNGKSTSAAGYQSTNVSAEVYRYIEGECPKLENEVALTQFSAEKIGAVIGDTVIVTSGNVTEKFVITGTFQSMNNMGDGVRFSECYEKLPYEIKTRSLAAQVKFLDNPNESTVSERQEKIKTLFTECEVSNGIEYAAFFLEGTVDQLENVRYLFVVVVILIDILVAVLMVKSFITKERGEIAMLKSLGFSNGSLLCWQTLRIGIVMIIATIIGALLSEPISQVSTAFIFKMMGATSVDFYIKPLEVFFIYPAIILAFTLLASLLAATQLIRIDARETSGIE